MMGGRARSRPSAAAAAAPGPWPRWSRSVADPRGARVRAGAAGGLKGYGEGDLGGGGGRAEDFEPRR